MTDKDARMSDRLEASRLLVERGFGKATGEPPLPNGPAGPPPEIYRPVNPERVLALARLLVEHNGGKDAEAGRGTE